MVVNKNNLDTAVLFVGVAAALMLAAPPVRADGAGCSDGGACPGVDVSIDYTADYRRNLHGGIATGHALSGLLNAGVEWRSASLIPGAFVTTSASLIHVGGDGVSGELVGDLQGLNNIEADKGWYLYDLWTEIGFGANAANSARIGFLDLNEEFDTSDTAGFFISPPFGIGTDLAQTGENGPAVFPVTALGVRFGGAIGEAMQWRVAAYEGTPGRTDRHAFATAKLASGEGALVIGEVNFTPARLHKISFGAWTYTAAFERVDAGVSGNATRVKGNRGAYAMVDAPLGALGGAQVDGMVRTGVADARYNPVAAYVGGAVVVSKFMPGRPDDAIGFAVAHARTGDHFRNQLAFDGGAPAKSETAFELTWRSPLTDWLAIVPSVQYVATPGADRSFSNAWIAGVRFELSRAHSWPLVAREATPGAGDSLVVSSNP
jgi:porin